MWVCRGWMASSSSKDRIRLLRRLPLLPGPRSLCSLLGENCPVSLSRCPLSPATFATNFWRDRAGGKFDRLEKRWEHGRKWNLAQREDLSKRLERAATYVGQTSNNQSSLWEILRPCTSQRQSNSSDRVLLNLAYLLTTSDLPC